MPKNKENLEANLKNVQTMKWKKGFWITKMFPFDCVIKNLIELFIDGFYGKMYGLVNDEKPDYHRHGFDNVNKKECAFLLNTQLKVTVSRMPKKISKTPQAK